MEHFMQLEWRKVSVMNMVYDRNKACMQNQLFSDSILGSKINISSWVFNEFKHKCIENSLVIPKIRWVKMWLLHILYMIYYCLKTWHTNWNRKVSNRQSVARDTVNIFVWRNKLTVSKILILPVKLSVPYVREGTENEWSGRWRWTPRI